MPIVPVYYARQSLPGQAAAVPGDVASAGAAMGALSDTARRTAVVLDEYAQKEKAAQDTINLLDRATKAKSALTDYQISLEGDQDYATKRARFEDKAKEIRAQFGDGLDSVTQARFFAHFDEAAATKTVAVAHDARVQMIDDGRAKYAAYLDSSIRTAVAAGSVNEREAAVKGIVDATETAKASGFLTAQEAEAHIKGAGAAIDTVRAERLITDNPGAAVAALDTKSGQFAAMDPLRREQFREHAIRTVKAEARAARAEIRGDARDALTVMSRGDDYAGFDALRAKAATADPETAKALDDAKGRLDRLRDFTLQPPADQAAAIDALAAKTGGLSGSDSVELAHMRTIADATARGLAADPLMFAAQRKVIAALPALDPSRPETWTVREQAAQYVQAYYGLPRAPLLTDPEAKALPDAFQRLGHVQQAKLLDDMRGALAQANYRQVVEVLAKKSPALAIAAQPEFAAVAPQILEGAEIRKKTPEVMPAGTDTQPVFNSFFGTDAGFAFQLNPALRQVYVDAAKDKYAYDKAKSGAIDKSFDPTAMEQALRDVTGGDMVKWNGRKLLPPRAGMSQDQLERGLSNLADADLTMVGPDGVALVAVTPAGQKVTANDVRRWGQFHSLDVPGLYLVTLRNTPVLGQAEDGQGAPLPFVIDLRNLSLAGPARTPALAAPPKNMIRPGMPK
jgi:hypothetical protein